MPGTEMKHVPRKTAFALPDDSAVPPYFRINLFCTTRPVEQTPPPLPDVVMITTWANRRRPKLKPLAPEPWNPRRSKPGLLGLYNVACYTEGAPDFMQFILDRPRLFHMLDEAYTSALRLNVISHGSGGTKSFSHQLMSHLPNPWTLRPAGLVLLIPG